MLDISIKGKRGGFALSADLNVPNGVTALVGASGAGKSSLLRFVAGLDTPEDGRITLGDRVFCDRAAGVNMPTEQRRIGMVFQRPALLPHLSVRDNVHLGARGQKMPDQLLVQTGCDLLLDRPVSALSGGEGQRVMLARALVGQPDLLVLDEPLSALDPAACDKMLSLFAQIFPTLGVPIVYVTHGVDEAGRVAERFALMENGAVQAVGDAASVFGRSGLLDHGGLNSVLSGQVRMLEEDGLARIVVADQVVEVSSAGLHVGADVRLRVWARDVVLATHAPKGLSARNRLSGRITTLSDLPDGQVHVGIDVGGQSLAALVMARTRVDMALGVGTDIVAIFKSATVEQLVEIS